jgi:hypothetical protein
MGWVMIRWTLVDAMADAAAGAPLTSVWKLPEARRGARAAGRRNPSKTCDCELGRRRGREEGRRVLSLYPRPRDGGGRGQRGVP